VRIGIDVSTILNFGVNVGSGRYIFNLLNSLLNIIEQFNSNNSKNNNNNNKNYNLYNYFYNTFTIKTAKYENINNDELNKNNNKKEKKQDNNDKDNKSPINLNDNYYKFVKNLSFIFTGWYKSEENLEIINKLKEKYPNIRIRLVFFKLTQEKFDSWSNKDFPPIEIKGFKADVFHCPDYLILPTLNKNIILTIHDLSFYRFPEFNFDWFVKKYQQLVLKNALRAKKIIADSQSTKQDIINFMKIDEKKINVVYLAADEKFKAMAPETLKLKKDTLEKFKIPKKYILSVGTIEPRKNFKTLIRAFNIFKKTFPISQNYCLVIVGKTGWKSEETYEEYNKSLFKEDIILTGLVNDEDLVLLYQNTSLFVYPSIFEGFGLPVLEAMSCGAPVIATNTSSILEIYSNKDFLLNPLDETAMANKINIVLTNEKIKNDLVNFSLQQAKKFSWGKTAFQTLRVYYSCVNK
jgi:glycosyltransferase involved in cell wall biosynthesis